MVEDGQADPSRRVWLSWPPGYSARSLLGMTVVFDGHGWPVARTGTRLHIPGGVGPDGTFEACFEGITALP